MNLKQFTNNLLRLVLANWSIINNGTLKPPYGLELEDSFENTGILWDAFL